MKHKFKTLVSIIMICVLLCNVMIISGAVNVDFNINADEIDIRANIHEAAWEYYQMNGYDYYADPITEDDLLIINPYANNPWEYYNVYDLTASEQEIIIERIAKGENVRFLNEIQINEINSINNANDGVQENEYMPINPTWSGTFNSNTHQFVAASAGVLLKNEKSSIYNGINALLSTGGGVAVLTSNSDWPDHDSVESAGLNRKHFYYWPSGSDYHGSTTTDNAKTRFLALFDEGVAACREARNMAQGNARETKMTEGLMKFAGAIHYFCDLYTPVHTGQSTGSYPPNPITVANLLKVHMDYEAEAHTYRHLFNPTSGGLYHGYYSSTLSHIAEYIAYVSYTYYPSSPSDYYSSYGWALNSNIRDLAGLMNWFYEKVMA